MFTMDLAGILDVLSEQQLLLGFFLAGAGLVFMCFGIRVSRVLVAISFGVLGFVICSLLPVPNGAKLGLAFMGAIVWGAASTFFIRVSLTILAGAWAGYGAVLGAGALELPPEAAMGLAAIGFACAVGMAVIMYEEVTIFVLSLEGSILFIAGLVILANQSLILWTQVRDMLINNPVFAPFALMAGAVTGFYWQSAELRQRDAGMSA